MYSNSTAFHHTPKTLPSADQPLPESITLQYNCDCSSAALSRVCDLRSPVVTETLATSAAAHRPRAAPSSCSRVQQRHQRTAPSTTNLIEPQSLITYCASRITFGPNQPLQQSSKMSGASFKGKRLGKELMKVTARHSRKFTCSCPAQPQPRYIKLTTCSQCRSSNPFLPVSLLSPPTISRHGLWTSRSLMPTLSTSIRPSNWFSGSMTSTQSVCAFVYRLPLFRMFR